MVSGKVTSATNPHRPYPPCRRVWPVEKALEWAWRDELPKAPRMESPDGFIAAWKTIAGYGEALASIDGGVNRFGLAPDMGADAEPHPDAVALFEAAVALDAWEIDLPGDWSPAPELDAFGGMTAAALSLALRRMRRQPSLLIGNRAIMGVDAMAMTIGPTEISHERDASGRERWFVRREVWSIVGVNPDGTDRVALESIEAPGLDKRRRPLPGAYRKSFLDPDPVDALIARAEHELWHAALSSVAETLAGRLETIDLAPPSVPARPWAEKPSRLARILPDLSAGRRRRPAEKNFITLIDRAGN